MRKRIHSKVLFLFWVLICLSGSSTLQANLSDSLRQAVHAETENMDIPAIAILVNKHKYKNLPLAVYYSEMALSKARRQENPESLFNIYRFRGYIYEENNLLHQALTEYENALNFAEKENNKTQRQTIYIDMAIVNKKLGNYKKTREYYSKVLSQAQETGDLEMVQHSYNNLGSLYELVGDYDNATEYYYKSLAIAEKRDAQKGVIQTLQNIGELYVKTQNTEQALENIEKAYQMSLQLKDTILVANVLYAYGKILNKTGETEKALEKLFSSLEIFQDIEIKTDIVKTLIEISNNYIQIEKYDKAQEYFELCFDKYKDYLSNQSSAALYNNQGLLYQKLEKNEQAKEALLKGLAISEKHDYKSLSQENHHALYKIYRGEGNAEKALYHMEASDKLSKYIQNNERIRRISEVQFQYEEEKTAREIQELQFRSNRLFFFSLSFILFLISGFLFYTNKIKIRNNKKLLAKAEEIDNQNRRLTESNEALSQFAYVAAHDLKEPLRNIGSFITLLQKKYGKSFNDEANNYMSFVSRGAKRMNNLLTDLLEFSSLTTQEASNELIGLDSVIEEVVSNLQDKIVNQNALIDYPEPMPSMRMKRIHLVQLFQNLISKSLKFVEGRPIVKIDYQMEANHILLSITDNGIGIKKEFEKKVFRLFHQLEKNKGYEGTGIGLTICKSIVDKYNGQIWLESNIGDGTRFFIRLPLNQDDIASEANTTKERNAMLAEVN